MNRHIVAGLIGLAVAGCAQDQAGGPRSRGVIGPVGMVPPMSSINEAINRDNPNTDPSTLRSGHPPDLARTQPPAIRAEAAPKDEPVAQSGAAASLAEAATTATPPETAATEPVAAAPSAGPAPVAISERIPIQVAPSTPEVLDNLPGPAADPIMTPASTEAAPTVSAETPKPAEDCRDPLLGPDPDIMPEITLPPTIRAKPTESRAFPSRQ